ncbi:MAG: beta-glucosidase [Geminicoccaceae bacterium]
MTASPFASFFGGGFECSSHRRRDGVRLDLLAATGHDRHVAEDYRLLARHGLRTARDGLRWHLIETAPGRYDWSSFLPMLHAARATGLQVAWDLCHYGYPDGARIWEASFVERFARFAAAAARLVRDETDAVPIYCPVNEISYWAWAGGTVGKIAPGVRRRGSELKRQLVRCAIAAIEAIRAVDPRARFLHAEPLIHIRAASTRSDHLTLARRQTEAQFEAWDLLTGRLMPELGGRPDYLDLCGLNYYPDNQWLPGGRFIPMGHHLYRPMRELLAAVHARYGRPLYIAETGAEGSARAAWLHYVAGEVGAAIEAGLPVLGVCLYPVLAYPGWEDGRLCETGLFSAADGDGQRIVAADVAAELARQQGLFGEAGFTALQRAGAAA